MRKQTPPLDGLMYAKVKDFSESSTRGAPNTDVVTRDITQANVITSMIVDNVTKHKVVIDLDLPAKLVPSSTPGNSHLFIDVEMETKKYFKLMKALVRAGLVERGFYDASKNRGYSAVRLPWIKKTEAEMERSRVKREVLAADHGMAAVVPISYPF